MKKHVYFVFFLICCSLQAAPLSLPISSEQAILINAETGAILFEKDAFKQAFPASITKVATALYALKTCGHDLDQIVRVKPEALASITPQAKRQSNYRNPPYWLETDGNHIGMKKGEEMPLRHVLYGMLISSANDAANVIAQHIGGSIPKFMDRLNHYLKEIGCKSTQFLNPHGFHHPDHLTTAYDMAIIAREAMKYPFFRQIVSTVRYTSPATNLELERNFIQTNLLLRQGTYYYPKAIGIKTGTTNAAGKTLVAAAKDGDRVLIAVILGNRDKGGRYEDAIKLFDAAFNQPKKRRFMLQKGPQSLTTSVFGAKTSLKTHLLQGLYYDFYPAEEPKVKVALQWKIPTLPIEKDQEVGSVKIVNESGKILQEKPLLSVERIDPTLWYKLKESFSFSTPFRKVTLLILSTLFLGVFFLLFKKKRKKSSKIFY